MVEGASPAPGAEIFQLNSTFATMNFAAAYQALYPTALDLGSVMNAANTGANLTLSAGDLVISTSGTGTSLSINNISAPDTVIWEFEILALEAGVLYSCGYAADIGFGQDVETTPSNQFPPQAFDCYFSDGTTLDNVGSDIATAWSVGDSVAFVYESDLGRIELWHNGSPQTTLPVMNTDGFAYVAQEP